MAEIMAEAGFPAGVVNVVTHAPGAAGPVADEFFERPDVHVNDQTIADEPQLPLGGVKDSGWGRSGPESMADFTEVQWITIRDGAGHYPI